MQHSNGFLQLVNDAKSRIREVTVASVREKLQRGHPFHFIDIREDHEWSRGRAEGAVHLGKGIIERDIEGLVPDAGEEIVLYCGGGYRSALSAQENLPPSTMTPPRELPCPPMYFVIEWTTMSNP